MTTIGFSDLRRGTAIELDGQPYEVIEYTRVKMQQRAPVVRIKLRSLRDGKVTEKSFSNYTNTFQLANVDYRPVQYLYTDGQMYNFMDTENYEQLQLTAQQLGANVNYLKEEMNLEIGYYKGEPLIVRLPITVDLKVVSTPPGVRGDTAQGGTKPAELETGITVQVPLFVSSGETIRLDTRTGEYLERV